MTVAVHYNELHACWSVLARPGGGLLNLVERLQLRKVRFVLDDATRRQSVAAGTRSVHAWAVGLLVTHMRYLSGGVRVQYSVRRGFHVCNTRVRQARLAEFAEDIAFRCWGIS